MSAIIPLTAENFFPILRDNILNASNSIHILLYQFNRYPGKSNSKVTLINHALLKAHASGVQIAIILNASFQSPKGTLANEKTVEFFRSQGIPARIGPKNLRIHSKLFIFDKSRVILGSHNLSERALTKNVDISLFIENKALAEQLFAIFQTIWSTP